jgi:tetratricopeptide (TPR) repeat protein
MAHLTALRNVAVVMFVLTLTVHCLPAQTGKSSAGTNAGTGVLSDPSPNLVLAGNVVMADGSLPPRPVNIERVCGQTTVLIGHTDRKGFFNFSLTELQPALQDVSESGRDAYNARGVVTFNADAFGIKPAGTGNAVLSNGTCDLRGSLAGYRSTSLSLQINGPTGFVNVGTLVLLSSEKPPSSESAADLAAPTNARKAYEKASAHIQKAKFKDAQANLEQAVKLYPHYASAWSDLGWLHERQKQLEEAREAFNRAREADDKFAPAYVGLASVAVRQSKWKEAEELSSRATQLNSKDFPVVFYYHAIANFQLGQLEKAETSARTAEQLDVRRVLPEVNLLVGSILATKGDYAQAASELKLYLTISPRAANADAVRQRVVELEQLAARPAALASAVPPSAPATPSSEFSWAALTNWAEVLKTVGSPSMPLLDFPQNWAPPDIDQLVPPVSPGVSCPLNDVLRGVGVRATELMDNLQEFSATERIEHHEVDKHGFHHGATSATFTYIAEIQKTSQGLLHVEEYRNGRTSQSFPAQMATKGTAVHALIFHPAIIADFNVTCEGLATVRGEPAWQLRFAQRQDRPAYFRVYQTKRGVFPVQLKGRAWISVDNQQVMRMETDLAKPIPEILLQKDHVIIDYRPVDFQDHHLQLWLPETAEIYGDLSGQRFRRKHSFSNFELFWVDVAQKDKTEF